MSRPHPASAGGRIRSRRSALVRVVAAVGAGLVTVSLAGCDEVIRALTETPSPTASAPASPGPVDTSLLCHLKGLRGSVDISLHLPERWKKASNSNCSWSDGHTFISIDGRGEPDSAFGPLDDMYQEWRNYVGQRGDEEIENLSFRHIDGLYGERSGAALGFFSYNDGDAFYAIIGQSSAVSINIERDLLDDTHGEESAHPSASERTAALAELQATFDLVARNIVVTPSPTA